MAGNKHVKSIVLGGQGDLVVSQADPHVFNTPLRTFDGKMRLLEAGFSIYEPTHEKLRVNHYMTKSRSYFLNFKQKSGTPMDLTGTPIIRTEAWWNEVDVNDVLDQSVLKYMIPLKNLLTLIKN